MGVQKDNYARTAISAQRASCLSCKVKLTCEQVRRAEAVFIVSITGKLQAAAVTILCLEIAKKFSQ